ERPAADRPRGRVRLRPAVRGPGLDTRAHPPRGARRRTGGQRGCHQPERPVPLGGGLAPRGSGPLRRRRLPGEGRLGGRPAGHRRGSDSPRRGARRRRATGPTL
ncbi:MAG: hypothetical protein AVDCRST_MAG10-619, partial [uncultured Acidimicrobiales bacterium]